MGWFAKIGLNGPMTNRVKVKAKVNIGQNQTRPGGWWVGGWTNWDYNHLSPQLRLELRLSLAKSLDIFLGHPVWVLFDEEGFHFIL